LETKDIGGDKLEDKITEAKKVLEQEKAERVSKCLQEINEALEKYNCYLDVSATLSTPSPNNPTGIKFAINVLPKGV
jgi:predicted component of type VI protein secretion system